MRRLDFEPGDHDKRFILCYQALCFAEAPLPRNELRLHGDILRKMEGIGQIANPNKPDDQPYMYRCVGGGEIIVSEIEYAIIKRFLAKFLDQVIRALSREMDRALEWIESVPEIKEPTPTTVT